MFATSLPYFKKKVRYEASWEKYEKQYNDTHVIKHFIDTTTFVLYLHFLCTAIKSLKTESSIIKGPYWNLFILLKLWLFLFLLILIS